jgi:UDP-GlcNAc:undecaprenyl-phosphate GlcNAc-1-phosphate transferase
VPYDHFINPLYVSLIPYFVISYLITTYVMPFFISLMRDYGIVTNPSLHNHPSMLLKGPSARGGGVLFTVIFFTLSLLFVGFSKDFLGFYVSLILVGLLSMLDDYQNTHPNSSFRIIENPFLRLLLLVSVVSITVMSGFKFESIINPLQSFVNGSFINFTNFSLLSGVLTVVWIVWFMNVLSWSNGVDGQYSGIVGIAFIIVAILSLRFDDIEAFHKRLALLSIISAGISFGTVKHMWYPSKIMWGFGAVSAGLVLAVLSFLSQSKIITSVIIILIPFLDALVTLLRRLFQGKNPLKGDKNHLHHILLRRGWNIPKIALFYWFTTLFFGVLGLLTAEILTIQVSFIIIGVVAFLIIVLNLQYIIKKDENTIYRR